MGAVPGVGYGVSSASIGEAGEVVPCSCMELEGVGRETCVCVLDGGC